MMQELCLSVTILLNRVMYQPSEVEAMYSETDFPEAEGTGVFGETLLTHVVPGAV